MAAKVKDKPLVEEEKLDDVIGEDLDLERKIQKEKKKKAKSGMGPKIFIIIFVLLIIGALVGILGFNLFDIRDRYLASTLKNIPIIKNLVDVPETDEPKKMTPEEMTARIKELEAQLEAAQKLAEDGQKSLSLKNEEIDRLKELESQHTEFRAERDEFYRMIAENNPSAYAAFYEKISPELAEELYPEVKEEAERQQEIKRYLAAINETDESSAARMLEQLIPTDLDLVVAILQRVNSRLSGAILGEMSPENGASVLKRWDPLTY